MRTKQNEARTVQKVHRFTCDNHRDIVVAADVDSPRQAGEHFAALKARAKYGKSGTVGALRVGSYAQDGSLFEVEAFIGTRARDGAVTGRNVTFTVYRS